MHIDNNTVGPTFYFILEELQEEDGGELTFRHYPRDKNPFMQTMDTKVNMKVGKVVYGVWDCSYHFVQPYTGAKF